MMQALAVLLMLFASDDAALRPGDHTRTLHVAGHERTCLVHIPPQYAPATPMPRVLAFHGGGANAANMVVSSGLNEKADLAGFIAVYPEGSGRLERMLTFNAVNCCRYAVSRNIDRRAAELKVRSGQAT
jgi:polyhydroxybutyrate depolymerase